MRIVIDMQGAQAESRNRGIGRYSLALSKEMSRLRGKHDVVIVLNGLFHESVEHIRASFAGLLPVENIHVWDAAGPVSAADKSNDARRRASEISYEAFLASVQPDIVLITSIFEGLGDDAVTSIGYFTSQLATAVILYDLIPFIHKGIYLANPVVECWYLNKLDHLRRADLLLSISSSSGREAVDYLGFPKEKVVNISTACDSHFYSKTLSDADYMHLQKTYGLTRSFVMYTGGIDHRKNIEALIHAYASMPMHILAAHQLAIVCAIKEPDRKRLMQLSAKEGLADDQLIITGFVSDGDLFTLYNACKLFVFPSWHEGFGLPALEAMACGRAVIGSNISSIPEVIGREDALFNPFDDQAIGQKIAEVLTNDKLRSELEKYGLERVKRFSWEQTARRAWQALETFVEQRSRPTILNMTRRPRLAYVSPFPPAQSGIADYSAELLPELARHYEIEVIVTQYELADPWVHANCPIRDVNWFRSNFHRFDRVMYHFGNSQFHSHMFGLLTDIPGVVVLHDFFLSSIISHMDDLGVMPHGWNRALLHSHGWLALQARHQTNDSANIVWEYPCNLEVLQQAIGMIVHSEYSCRLAEKWYGAGAADDWTVIPLLRVPSIKTNRHEARRKLGLGSNEFIVCSFGMLGPTKLNHRLLTAWLASPLANDPHCRLVFVGQNHIGEYGIELARSISGVGNRIKITGWVDAETYRTWLAVADVGAQLRSISRGETSAAVLDCMNNGLATIVNANGSMADLPTDAVWMLHDEFSDEQLIEAMTTLWRDAGRRNALGQCAKETIHIYHQPRRCAEQYADAIENYYKNAWQGLPSIVNAIASIEPLLPTDNWMRVSTVLANNFPPRPRRKQLFLDISELVQRDVKSGIQRVVRALLHRLLLNPPTGWVVEPVYAETCNEGYRYARRFTSKFLGVYEEWADDELVNAWSGDIFLGLDLQPIAIPAQMDYLLGLHRRGINVFFVVYDLLPILLPQFFTAEAEAMHRRWIEAVSNFDGAVCISNAVADELADWQRIHGPSRLCPFKIGWFHLGADLENSVPTCGLPGDASLVFETLAKCSTFLMVGTIEPRKGYTQTLAAFEQLWNEGVDANLIIVGQQGWKMEPLVEELSVHREIGKHLFWLKGISDEYLKKIYVASTCLIVASEGEGFGLPLIEAAQHELPIIARDIPVFREVAGECAFYFNGLEPQAIAKAVQQWLELYKQGHAPASVNMPRLTWKQSADQLIKAVLPE